MFIIFFSISLFVSSLSLFTNYPLYCLSRLSLLYRHSFLFLFSFSSLLFVQLSPSPPIFFLFSHSSVSSLFPVPFSLSSLPPWFHYLNPLQLLSILLSLFFLALFLYLCSCACVCMSLSLSLCVCVFGSFHTFSSPYKSTFPTRYVCVLIHSTFFFLTRDRERKEERQMYRQTEKEMERERERVNEREKEE